MDAAVPVGLGLVAAMFFATSTLLVRAHVRKASPLVALGLSLSVNVVVLWVIAVAWFDVTVDLWRWRYFVVAGTLAPVMGRFFNYAGIDALGVNISTPITYSYPLVSVLLAMAFLDERLAGAALIGGLLVIAGGVTLGTVRGEGPVTFDRKYLLLPVTAAVLYGASHVFRKMGIDLVSSPIIAAAVTTTTSWAVLVLYLAARPEQRDVSVGRTEVLYFGLAGLATSVAIPVLYLALQLGNVVIVTPVLNTSPLFVLAFSYVFFRGEELFTPRVVAGTASVVVGVTLLSLFSSV